jgi:TRAP-type C4-dicarboxylate transport system substrate-binding protein
LYKKYRPKELADVHLFYMSLNGPGDLHTARKAVQTVADLRGMKVRTSGQLAENVKALGGVPVTMPQGDVYEAMRKGIVDATIAPSEVLKGWKQAEVAHYTTNLGFMGYAGVMMIGMNKKKWESLPKDIQGIMTAVSNEWPDKHSKAWEDSSKEGLEYSIGLGNKVLVFSPEEQAKAIELVRPVYYAFAKSVDAKGLPGTQFLEELLKMVRECK